MHHSNETEGKSNYGFVQLIVAELLIQFLHTLRRSYPLNERVRLHSGNAAKLGHLNVPGTSMAYMGTSHHNMGTSMSHHIWAPQCPIIRAPQCPITHGVLSHMVPHHTRDGHLNVPPHPHTVLTGWLDTNHFNTSTTTTPNHRLIVQVPQHFA